MDSMELEVAGLVCPRMTAKLKVLETAELEALVRWLRERGISWGEKVSDDVRIGGSSSSQYEGYPGPWLTEGRLCRLSAVAELMLLRERSAH